MRKLSIFDDGAKVATITLINGSIFIFARTPREWKEMQRLTSGHGLDPKDPGFLERVIERAHSYDYSTELIDE